MDDLHQAGLDLEAGECCAAVGIAIGLVAHIVSGPIGTAGSEPDQIAAARAAVTS
jgi:hypothetical protein